MQSVKTETVIREPHTIYSAALGRQVRIDLYLPPHSPFSVLPVLLVNDGQELDKMQFKELLDQLYVSHALQPLLCVGLHAGHQRKLEYGTAHAPDYHSRGIHAPRYSFFVLRELMPFIRKYLPDTDFTDWGFAGFSLGGLSALDIAWAHPQVFRTAGVFSGSLWWRSLDKDDPRYSDESHRLMHNLINEGHYAPGFKFFFECGTADEEEDRNNNGVIDSIDDTKDLIRELIKKGYSADHDIFYMEIPGGTHDAATWARAMPDFLRWAWGKK